jgi:K+-transporting ATPase ATPase A chain
MANNSQNFAGPSANSVFYNSATPIAMAAGRFGLAIPALGLAGLFSQQSRKPIRHGVMPTDTPLFAVLMMGAALIVGALSYSPALALGPIVDHLLLQSALLQPRGLPEALRSRDRHLPG